MPAMILQRGTSNWWQYTVIPPSGTTNLNCVFNNGSGTWDNNGGANWNFNVSANSNPQPPSQPQNLSRNAGADESDQFELVGGLGRHRLHREPRRFARDHLDGGTSYSDTGLAANSYHCYSIVASNSVGFSTPSATVCTNTLAAAPTNLPPFALDGAFDYPGYLLASNGMVLYAAVRGTTLYVATGSPGTSGPNDYFIFVSDQLLPGASAPRRGPNPAPSRWPPPSPISPAKARIPTSVGM